MVIHHFVTVELRWMGFDSGSRVTGAIIFRVDDTISALCM